MIRGFEDESRDFSDLVGGIKAFYPVLLKINSWSLYNCLDEDEDDD